MYKQLNTINMRTQQLLTRLFVTAMLLAGVNTMKANNVSITGTAVTGSTLSFNISWENSWYASAAPANWDAVWVFVKYQDCNTKLWAHANLSTTANDFSAGTPLQVDPVSDGKGVFVRRSAVGGGNISNVAVSLKLNIPAGTYNYKVYGIEMVNVPQASFHLGDAVGGYGFTPLTVDANAQSNGLTTAQLGSYSADLQPTFPMGYDSFYCMKYEITQEQYADFLNSLTFTQQKNRVTGDPISTAGTYVTWPTYSYRNGLAIVTPGNNGAIPAVFGCDGTAGTPNGSNDGQNIAMNSMSWADLASYLDWAALRPMTEMEFEKVCRGTLPRVDGEYIWGSTEITQSTSSSITNAKMSNEISSVTVNNGMCNYGMNTATINYGPTRVGMFATGSSGRLSAGAAFYGAMEMGGNLGERTIAVNVNGKNFIGELGDGTISSTGFADVATWPSNSTASGVIMRGGDYLNAAVYVRTSDRSFLFNDSSARSYYTGGRGVR